MTSTLVESLTASPLRSLLRHRLSSRVDRALVFLSARGDAVAHPHGAQACPYPRPSLTMVRRKAYDRACWVSLVEHDAVVGVPDQTPGGVPRTSTRRAVSWWVCDPVIAARKRVLAQDIPAWIAHDIATRGGPGRTRKHDPTQPNDPTGRPDDVRAPDRQMYEMGIAYRIHPRPGSPVPFRCPEAPMPVMPLGWGEDQRAAYHFYREVVSQGPHGLATLWLLHHPDQAREVLDWTVQNQKLLTDQAAWEHSLAALLQGLDRNARAFIGVTMAQVLSGLGIPQAEEVLKQVRGVQRQDRNGDGQEP